MRREGVERFFAFARERHQIYLRRQAGMERPWTRDPILQKYRFTNVFRELDKTTVWFRKHVRDPLRSKPEVLLATLTFRLLNRIETGQAVFCQEDFHSRFRGKNTFTTAFEDFAEHGDVRVLRDAIRTFSKRGPYVTGAYIISSPPGLPKLDGVLRVIEGFASKKCERNHCGFMDWECVARRLIAEPGKHTLKAVWTWLREFPYVGPFHAYEITSDLSHTDLLSGAPDVMTWANPGPGAKRGLSHTFGRDHRASASREQLIQEMRDLLEMSRDKRYWPQGDENWPKWTMREPEHGACEWWKYEKVRLGLGRPRGVYR